MYIACLHVCGMHSLYIADLQDDIKQSNVKFMTAFNSKNLKQLSELYTINCKLMPTGTDVVYGRDGEGETCMYEIEGGGEGGTARDMHGCMSILKYLKQAKQLIASGIEFALHLSANILHA